MTPEQLNGWLVQQGQPHSSIAFNKPLIMGVLNVTSDSFYDGGAFLSLDRACEQAFHLIAHGADIIDIGGESTRPGALELPLDVELSRVIPVIQELRNNSDICISIDTYKPEVMVAAVQAGANMVNDVYALRHEGALDAAARLKVPVCLMHMQGQPQNMQENPNYPDGVLKDVMQFFSERLVTCERAGINLEQIILDPGFGFGKRVRDNLNLMYHLKEFNRLKRPILLGVSRKSTIGVILDKNTSERLIGSISLSVFAALQGVGILRTHDVDETNQALKMITAVYESM